MRTTTIHAGKGLRAPAFALTLVGLAACGGHKPPPPAEPPYMPRYAYKTKDAATAPREITIAVIAPVVKESVRGADGQVMVKALAPAMLDLVSAKGMKYRGPFEALPPDCRSSRDALTFPDKKGSDLVLCTEMQVTTGWQPQNVRQQGEERLPDGRAVPRLSCDLTVFYGGRVDFLVLEPLSGEVMWRKNVQLDGRPDAPTSTVIAGFTGPVCAGQALGALTVPGMSAAEPSPDGDAGNQYRRGLERVFWEIMHGIDQYMSPDEFEMLSKQAQELRDRKVY